MYYFLVRSGLWANVLLGVLGVILIWQGITGNVIKTELGSEIFPRWMYVLGGCVLLLFPTMFILMSTEAGRAWLGI